MDYSKQGKSGTTMQQLANQAEFTRAIGTGGGASMEQMVSNGMARERKSKRTITPQELSDYCKPVAIASDTLY